MANFEKLPKIANFINVLMSPSLTLYKMANFERKVFHRLNWQIVWQKKIPKIRQNFSSSTILLNKNGIESRAPPFHIFYNII